MYLLKKYPSILNWIEPKFNLHKLRQFKADENFLELNVKLLNKKVELLSLLDQLELMLQKNYKLWCPLEEGFSEAIHHHVITPTPIMYKGCMNLNKTVFSIVGSRKITEATKLWMKIELQAYLKKNKNITVASGGAYGVDQLAHSIALYNQIPTYCFIPAGFNNIYPKNLQPMVDQIIDEGGAVISPFPPDFPIYKSNFYYRNRILVLMSDIVLVTEARRRSGSMMTASLAAEFGVTTLTLPQSPLQSYMGNLDLIESGVPFVKDRHDLQLFLDSNF